MVGAVAAALRSVIYMAGFIFFFGWVALGVRQFDAALGVELPMFARAVGATFMILGLTIVLVCGGMFSLFGRGTPAIFDPPRAFVVRGLYRWVRNPMYIGGLILLFGFGLWHRSAAMVLMMPVMALVLHLFVILIEEPGLEQRFGTQYDDYKKTVRRWSPRQPR